MSSGLLGKMLKEVGPDKPETAPEDVPDNQEDLIVFMRDFENSDLSATQRLAALVELIKQAK